MKTFKQLRKKFLCISRGHRVGIELRDCKRCGKNSRHFHCVDCGQWFCLVKF